MPLGPALCTNTVHRMFHIESHSALTHTSWGLERGSPGPFAQPRQGYTRQYAHTCALTYSRCLLSSSSPTYHAVPPPARRGRSSRAFPLERAMRHGRVILRESSRKSCSHMLEPAPRNAHRMVQLARGATRGRPTRGQRGARRAAPRAPEGATARVTRRRVTHHLATRHQPTMDVACPLSAPREAAVPAPPR